MITEYISQKTGWPILNEPTGCGYHMFNTGGVECEVGEFLYGIVRMHKPKMILETGTHYGVSSTYMALALKKNGVGRITTIDPSYYEEAKLIHSTTETLDYITQVQTHAEKFDSSDKYQLLFLDSEPSLRFPEFERFFDMIDPGGIIIIHDLNRHLSYNPHQDKSLPIEHWPFGDFRPILGKYIKEFKIQSFGFTTPRGITLFQKNAFDMSYTRYLKNEI